MYVVLHVTLADYIVRFLKYNYYGIIDPINSQLQSYKKISGVVCISLLYF